MQSWPIIVALAGGPLLVQMGCAATPMRAEIPTGRWSGTGFATAEMWGEGDETEKLERGSQHANYPTFMSISERNDAEKRAFMVEIGSRSNELSGTSEPLRLKFNLVGEKRISEAAVLYRTEQDGFFKWMSHPKSKEDADSWFNVSCMTVNKAVILQIHYSKNFVDTIRFEGDQVEKSGVLFDEDKGMIHWCETLTRQADE